MIKLLTLDKHLDSNERMVEFFRPSRYAYLFQYIFFGALLIISIFFSLFNVSGSAYFIFWNVINLISIIVLIYSIIMLLRIEYRIWSRRYALTDERVLYSRRIFSENFKSATYNRITDIGFYQTFWDKIMNTGTIVVNTAGTDNYEIRYRKIHIPLKIKRIINDHQTIHSKKAFLKK